MKYKLFSAALQKPSLHSRHYLLLFQERIIEKNNTCPPYGGFVCVEVVVFIAHKKSRPKAALFVLVCFFCGLIQQE